MKDNLKQAILNVIETFNNNEKDYKITYYEIFTNDMIHELSYCLYIEDVKNNVEYQSENYFSYDERRNKINQLYDIVMGTLLNDLGGVR